MEIETTTMTMGDAVILIITMVRLSSRATTMEADAAIGEMEIETTTMTMGEAIIITMARLNHLNTNLDNNLNNLIILLHNLLEMEIETTTMTMGEAIIITMARLNHLNTNLDNNLNNLIILLHNLLLLLLLLEGKRQRRGSTKSFRS
jgi:hypothetical protein